MRFKSAIWRSDSGVNGTFPSSACSTTPSSRSPSVMSFNSARALRTLSRRFSIRAPVWTLSTTSRTGSRRTAPRRGARIFVTTVIIYQYTNPRASGIMRSPGGAGAGGLRGTLPDRGIRPLGRHRRGGDHQLSGVPALFRPGRGGDAPLGGAELSLPLRRPGHLAPPRPGGVRLPCAGQARRAALGRSLLEQDRKDIAAPGLRGAPPDRAGNGGRQRQVRPRLRPAGNLQAGPVPEEVR